ncbi:4-(cytidine 5'-diphospho)-2-C-methyl-D-erythritol kinase [Demequina sp. SYSU T00039]|uniref:4-diphosphocytidyl-2-C-methyl-D-erythritol kinase n=1 Tax=Demequina lignilytica TaxID=3051663 RepID=A0AAW7M150_9MICO|nr:MULTISPECIES: 4-(cytidine 5'-diphospho)-2-C-methyl-D-erythritol kinase [unclassified Demequina]MDN4477575.1 4-(cytidine 5'-diphospho)-2-C-methyl-D-erythritol kinase [Demequina sp. SYSU T00039-1]MDN4488074.1 4-(cytidine 5'-diphospho)-2-C-methyl-D-erythritol kinase [Demequina sp. SYSU T00039]MDN4490515.1 4-(cytidine 5'-diphospho)-2-C-methyl-D-erythritol kinase [Demequina sp. SYSU T00068]
MTRTVRAKAPAKVNLQLTVGPVAEDGFHPLVTVFQAVDLFETVEATARTDGRITLTVDAAAGSPVDASGVPVDESNLAWRAAELVASSYGIADGVDLRIVKGVPVAGGMAGGSADAAAALVACAEAWDVGATRGELARLAARLGSDVPFSLHGHTAMGVGRGDQLTPVMSHGQFHWVVATQAEGLSTPRVYAEYDRRIAAREQVQNDLAVEAPVMTALMAGDPVALGRAVINDLEGPALSLMPRLEKVLDVAEEAEACAAMVSGSGPTVVALARSRQHALAIAAHLKAARVADAVLTATGPTAGTVLVQD